MKDLIDPLNEDTYDDRVIRSVPIRSVLSGPAFDAFYAKKQHNFNVIRKQLQHEIWVFHIQVWKALNA